jgi:apolipoprotein D and lipocalin family protein
MKKILLFCSALPLIGCGVSRPKLQPVENVDIQRYMGAWYVIAAIPIFVEKNAYNAVENYRLDPDGSVPTVFTFNKGALDGPPKTYKSRGYIIDRVNNSTWKVQFIWPFKAEYLITYLNEDYTQVIVSRNKRDYVWIMARTPQISDEDYSRLVAIVKAQGYDLTKLRKVPQKP